MSYRRKHSSHDLWLNYCQRNKDKLAAIGLPPHIFKTEDTFREYLTYGTVDGRSENIASVETLGDEQFWLLFDLVNSFDMPFEHFDEFEVSRLSRS